MKPKNIVSSIEQLYRAILDCRDIYYCFDGYWHFSGGGKKDLESYLELARKKQVPFNPDYLRNHTQWNDYIERKEAGYNGPLIEMEIQDEAT